MASRGLLRATGAAVAAGGGLPALPHQSNRVSGFRLARGTLVQRRCRSSDAGELDMSIASAARASDYGFPDVRCVVDRQTTSTARVDVCERTIGKLCSLLPTKRWHAQMVARTGRARLHRLRTERPPQRVLALQLELCLPKLVSSPAPGGLDRRTSGFQPESWPQGQSNESTPLTRRPSLSVPPNLRGPTPYEDAQSRPMSDLMAKIRKWLGLDKNS